MGLTVGCIVIPMMMRFLVHEIHPFARLLLFIQEHPKWRLTMQWIFNGNLRCTTPCWTRRRERNRRGNSTSTTSNVSVSTVFCSFFSVSYVFFTFYLFTRHLHVHTYYVKVGTSVCQLWGLGNTSTSVEDRIINYVHKNMRATLYIFNNLA